MPQGDKGWRRNETKHKHKQYHPFLVRFITATCETEEEIEEEETDEEKEDEDEIADGVALCTGKDKGIGSRGGG